MANRHHWSENLICRRVARMARQGAMTVEELIRQQVFHLRQWKMTRLGKQRYRGQRFEFTLMTYNILSQVAIENHRYLYRNCDQGCLEEEYRMSRILPEIMYAGCDVVCLQEVEEKLFKNTLRDTFKINGFGSLFKKRTLDKSDGCAVFWRKNKFSLVEHRDVEFQISGCDILDRNNVALIAVLRPRHPHLKKIKLHVATTHLLFNPRRGDIKLSQLRVLLAHLEKMALKRVAEEGRRIYHPVILCGDFNFLPHSPLYEFVDTGRLDVAKRMSGDMSGQAEGRNRGRQMHAGQLSLQNIGIDEAGRYKFMPNQSTGGSSENNSVDNMPMSPTSSGACSGKKLKYSMEPGSDENICSGNVSKVGSLDPQWLASVKNPEWVSAFRALNQIQGSTSPTHSDRCAAEECPSCFYHDFHFVPAYRFYNRDKRDLPLTAMDGNGFHIVDHIFYSVKEKHSSNSFNEGHLKLLGVYSLLHEQDVRDMEGLPNVCLGSDHISLMAKFAITTFKTNSN